MVENTKRYRRLEWRILPESILYANIVYSIDWWYRLIGIDIDPAPLASGIYETIESEVIPLTVRRITAVNLLFNPPKPRYQVNTGLISQSRVSCACRLQEVPLKRVKLARYLPVKNLYQRSFNFSRMDNPGDSTADTVNLVDAEEGLSVTYRPRRCCCGNKKRLLIILLALVLFVGIGITLILINISKYQSYDIEIICI